MWTSIMLRKPFTQLTEYINIKVWNLHITHKQRNHLNASTNVDHDSVDEVLDEDVLELCCGSRSRS